MTGRETIDIAHPRRSSGTGSSDARPRGATPAAGGGWTAWPRSSGGALRHWPVVAAPLAAGSPEAAQVSLDRFWVERGGGPAAPVPPGSKSPRPDESRPRWPTVGELADAEPLLSAAGGSLPSHCRGDQRGGALPSHPGPLRLLAVAVHPGRLRLRRPTIGRSQADRRAGHAARFAEDATNVLFIGPARGRQDDAGGVSNGNVFTPRRSPPPGR